MTDQEDDDFREDLLDATTADLHRRITDLEGERDSLLSRLKRELESAQERKAALEEASQMNLEFLECLMQARELLKHAKGKPGPLGPKRLGYVTTGSWNKARSDWAARVDPVARKVKEARERREAEEEGQV